MRAYNITFVFYMRVSICRHKVEVGMKVNGERRTSLSIPPGGSGKLYGIVVVPESCPRGKIYKICIYTNTQVAFLFFYINIHARTHTHILKIQFYFLCYQFLE